MKLIMNRGETLTVEAKGVNGVNAVFIISHDKDGDCQLLVSTDTPGDFNMPGVVYRKTLVPFNTPAPPVPVQETLPKIVETLTLRDLPLTTRTYNCLYGEDLKTLADVYRAAHRLHKVPNFGNVSIAEMNRLLAQYGLGTPIRKKS